MEQLYTERGLVQKQTAGEPSRPWSLVIVTLIAFFLPAGGAVLAVRNMGRLGAMDEKRAAELTVATIAVFAAGYSALLLAAEPSHSDPSTLSPAVTSLLSLGTAAATFFFQRHDFSTWRKQHPQTGTSPWYAAVGWALVYFLITAVAAIPFLLVLDLITSAVSS
jgi:hypothetical protein